MWTNRTSLRLSTLYPAEVSLLAYELGVKSLYAPTVGGKAFQAAETFDTCNTFAAQPPAFARYHRDSTPYKACITPTDIILHLDEPIRYLCIIRGDLEVGAGLTCLHKRQDLPQPTTVLEYGMFHVSNIASIASFIASAQIPANANSYSSSGPQPQAMVHVEDRAFMSERAFEEACRWLLHRCRQLHSAGVSVRLAGEVWLNRLIIIYHFS